MWGVPLPILSFQCHTCGLSQKKRLSKEVTEIACVCGKTAALEGAGMATIGFTAAVSGSEFMVKTQDSGMESFDLNYDRVIGEDAKDKWGIIYNRRRDKLGLLEANPGSSGLDIVKTADGNYDVKPSESRHLRAERLRRQNLISSNQQE